MIYEYYSYRGRYSFVEIKMEYLPTEKFKRNVVRSRLDLVGMFINI